MTSLVLWLKALHIIAFAAWMAGLWYLPRLFVYPSSAAPGSELSERFKVMERRLLRAITTPAMVATLVFGVALASVQAQWSEGWLHLKLVLVLGLAAAHGQMVGYVKSFQSDRRPRNERFFRMFNEVPTVLFVLIVLAVVLKPL